jgi:hypothetical protein
MVKEAPPTPKAAAVAIQKITKVATRLSAVEKEETKPTRRSPDLVPLTQEYEEYRKKLRALITAARSYHESRRIMVQKHKEVRVHSIRWCRQRTLLTCPFHIHLR